VPESFSTICTAHAGSDDTTVDGKSVLRDTYVQGYTCGVASVIMTNAHGTFSAFVGIPDKDVSSTGSASLRVTVLDQNSTPLTTQNISVTRNRPGVAFSVSISGASIIKIEFTGSCIVYGMTMTGQATLYDRIFAPTEPVVAVHGGIAVNPRLFAVQCNAAVTTVDTLLIHAVALEQWALSGQGCGIATLDLPAAGYAHSVFAGRFGLAAADQVYKLAHVTIDVLVTGGKKVRSIQLTAREGYGPRPFSVSLQGGTRLQITWTDSPVKLYALTLA
jgi:hypothetical protein